MSFRKYNINDTIDNEHYKVFNRVLYRRLKQTALESQINRPNKINIRNLIWEFNKKYAIVNTKL